MIVDDVLVDKLANLSKLEFDTDGKKAIKTDLSKILNFMEKLNELNTDGIEPLGLCFVLKTSLSNTNKNAEQNYHSTKRHQTRI